MYGKVRGENKVDEILAKAKLSGIQEDSHTAHAYRIFVIGSLIMD